MSDPGPVRLEDPWPVAGRMAPARVVFGSHVTNLGRGRAISDRHVAYYRRRAAGGCGVVVTETASVHPLDWPYERAPLAAECAAGWHEVAAACHEHGALVVASLGHHGGQGSSAYSRREMWAPSPVPEVDSRELPKVMEDQDIAEVIAGFGAATRLAMGSGCDGVEVDAGERSLLRAFLSPLTNTRADAWGGDRLRFAREVLTAVREELGSGLLMLRLCVDELAPWAGITPEQAVGLAVDLAPLVDVIVCVRGSIYSAAAARPDAHTPPGFNLAVTAAVADAVEVPVVLQGSIADVALAQQALGEGTCAAVEMTRAQIADPDLVRKTRAGQAAQIRPCLLCNATCQVRDARNPLVTCVAEPDSGHECTRTQVPSTLPVHVLVVGGGPAGLEAARVAAQNGHQVRLVEAEHTLGGSAALAARLPSGSRIPLLLDWWSRELERLGVTVEVGCSAEPDDVVRHAGPTVLATGSQDGDRDYQCSADAVPVFSAATALRHLGELPSGPAIVWDPVGGPEGIGLAELLAGDRKVTLVTPDHVPGTLLSRTGDLAPASARLQQAGVAILRRATLTSVGAEGVEVADRFGAARSVLPAAVLIDAGYRLPAATLLDPESLPDDNGRRQPIVVGDAVAPRTIHEAVLEGRRAANLLGQARR